MENSYTIVDLKYLHIQMQSNGSKMYTQKVLLYKEITRYQGNSSHPSKGKSLRMQDLKLQVISFL